MSAVEVLPLDVFQQEEEYEDGLTHIAQHCNHDWSLCGIYIGDCAWVDVDFEPDKDCVVCLELADTPCKCGRDYDV